jgi:hypothetical protein
MKKVTLLISLISSIVLSVEPVQEVIPVPGLTQNQIYSNVLLWASRTYNSAEKVITFEDKENGRIVLSPIASYTMFIQTALFYYSMQIDIKDEKVRVSIDNFRAANGSACLWCPSHRGRSEEAIAEVLSSFRVGIQNSTQIKDDNW